MSIEKSEPSRMLPHMVSTPNQLPYMIPPQSLFEEAPHKGKGCCLANTLASHTVEDIN